MLKRIYIDNFRCLVNFELEIDEINLFLGPNGSGKSSVFDVLRKLQAFVNGGQLGDIFDADDLSIWQEEPVQTFAVEIEGNGGRYKYQLAIEHDKARYKVWRVYERLSFNEQPLFNMADGQLKIYNDAHEDKIALPVDNSLPSAFVFSTEQDTKIEWFKERMERFIIVQLNPTMMAGESRQEETQPLPGMENFVSWYRYIYQDQGKAFEITTALQQVFDGFKHFKLVRAGEKVRLLKLSFSTNNGHSTSIDYRFSQLSDGARALVALYTLIHYARCSDVTLCIDEPENFIALREIQPWLIELYDYCSDGELQALLISHHPEVIDYLSSFAGYWFERDDNNAPVKVKPIPLDDESGLPISELVARGWLDE
jgi:energy-coupling factor transporter ATP-binding protein EcfA2